MKQFPDRNVQHNSNFVTNPSSSGPASVTPSPNARRSDHSVIPGTVLEFGDGGISVVDTPAARSGQSSEVKTVWISLAVILAVVLLIIAGIVLVVAHCIPASPAQTNRTESDCGEVPVDIESALADLGAFLSEANELEASEHAPRQGRL
jgi:hypothetical protein